MDTFLDVLAAAALAIAGFGVLGFVALKAIRLPVRAFLTRGNVGNIGLRIILMATGYSLPPSVETYLFIDQHVPEMADFILVSTLSTIVVLLIALTYWFLRALYAQR